MWAQPPSADGWPELQVNSSDVHYSTPLLRFEPPSRVSGRVVKQGTGEAVALPGTLTIPPHKAAGGAVVEPGAEAEQKRHVHPAAYSGPS